MTAIQILAVGTPAVVGLMVFATAYFVRVQNRAPVADGAAAAVGNLHDVKSRALDSELEEVLASVRTIVERDKGATLPAFGPPDPGKENLAKRVASVASDVIAFSEAQPSISVNSEMEEIRKRIADASLLIENISRQISRVTANERSR